MIVGNPAAEAKNVPFIESDLNRIFPGKETGTLEEMRAFKLTQKIKDADIVIDLHSTNTTDLSENSMVIVTKLDEATRAVLHIFNPPKILYMRYKSESALISQAALGIAFEYGKDDSDAVLNATLYDIAEILVHFNCMTSNPYINPRKATSSESYEVYDAFKKTFTGEYTLEPQIVNFTLCASGTKICTTVAGEDIYAEEDFYPILFGKNRYTEILGFKAKRFSL